jgi:hypothetical protein
LIGCIIEKFSIELPGTKPYNIPFYLTLTEFTHEQYGDCVTAFKCKLGLDNESKQALMVLWNVVMSPLALAARKTASGILATPSKAR